MKTLHNSIPIFPYITDFSKYENDAYDKWYGTLIKKEQIRLITMIKHRYAKTKLDPKLVIVYCPDGDFGYRKMNGYKMLSIGSPEYERLVVNGKYEVICNFNEVVEFYQIRK